MSKDLHAIRDPTHIFVRLDTDECAVFHPRPLQRLRHIHELALTYMLDPAATHKRFDRSLAVLELAGRVFDIVINSVSRYSTAPSGSEIHARAQTGDRQEIFCFRGDSWPMTEAPDRWPLPCNSSHSSVTTDYWPSSRRSGLSTKPVRSLG
jgi:hypothetical protein